MYRRLISTDAARAIQRTHKTMNYTHKNLCEIIDVDTVRVSPGVTRALEAGDAGLEILVFGPHVDNDVEIVEHCWSTP